MLDIRETNYSKAYVELYEIIRKLPREQLSKIPTNLIENIKQQRNLEYIWIYNDKKSICEQNLMIETKALIVELYEKFLCTEDTKEIWKNYDRICLNFIETEKHNKFNSNNPFKANDIFSKLNNKETTNVPKIENSTNTTLIEYNESIFTRFKNFIFKILHISK